MKNDAFSGFAVGLLAAGALIGAVDALARVKTKRLLLEDKARSASWLDGYYDRTTRNR